MFDSDLDEILAMIADGDGDCAADAIVDVADDLTEDDVTTIMAAARKLDPTDSGMAADIRDAIRDNTTHTVA